MNINIFESKAVRHTVSSIVIVAMLASIFMFPIFSESGRAKAADKTKISKTKATILKGKTLQLKMKNTKKNVKWSSSEKSIATVSKKGKVTAIKTGKATITAKIGKKKYTCKITIKNPIKVKFDANKGDVGKKSKIVTDKKKYGTLPKPTRSGYSFKGWYTKKSGGKKITSKSIFTGTKGKTLYAHWSKKSYKPNVKIKESKDGYSAYMVWKKIKGISGYQVNIYYSTDIMSSNPKTEVSFENVSKEKTKYLMSYVSASNSYMKYRIRTYRKTDGKIIYGPWSKTIGVFGGYFYDNSKGF